MASEVPSALPGVRDRADSDFDAVLATLPGCGAPLSEFAHVNSPAAWLRPTSDGGPSLRRAPLPGVFEPEPNSGTVWAVGGGAKRVAWSGLGASPCSS